MCLSCLGVEGNVLLCGGCDVAVTSSCWDIQSVSGGPVGLVEEPEMLGSVWVFEADFVFVVVGDIVGIVGTGVVNIAVAVVVVVVVVVLVGVVVVIADGFTVVVVVVGCSKTKNNNSRCHVNSYSP